MTNARWAALLTVIVLAGCSRTSTLYPQNDPARLTGILHITATRDGPGTAEAVCAMPSGEVLRGRSLVFDNSTYDVGSAFEMIRMRGKPAIISNTASYAVTSQGMTNYITVLYGDQGSSAECQGVLNTNGVHGTGVCTFSTGGIYRSMF